MPIDRDRLSCILAEDAIHGYRAACARHGVTQRTLQRYRKKLDDDEELSASVAVKKAAILKEWEGEAIRFMHRCLAKMAQLIDEATVKDLRNVNGAAKVVGEMLVAKGVLGGGQSGSDSQGAAPPAPPSGVRTSEFH